MSFAEDLKKIRPIEYGLLEEERLKAEKKEAISRFNDQIQESFVDLKKRGELEESIIKGFFYAEYWGNICHFQPYEKQALLDEALKKGDAEYYVSAFLIKAQKIFSEEFNIFSPLSAEEIQKTLEDLGFRNVQYEIVPVNYYRKCRLGETIFREYVKDKISIYYFSFEF